MKDTNSKLRISRRHAVLARRAFLDQLRATNLARHGLDASRKEALAKTDPSFFLELSEAEADPTFLNDLPQRIREDLCHPSDNSNTLAKSVLSTHPTGPLRNELSLLRFAKAFLDKWRQLEPSPEVITPGQVKLTEDTEDNVADIKELHIKTGQADPQDSLYKPPSWCEAGDRWRVQLGFLLRFILSGHPDFTRPSYRESWKETQPAYRPAVSHWYQRLYGLFSGQPAFGDDWLPISDWTEGLLLALLRWPGCRAPEEFGWVEKGIGETLARVSERIEELEQRRGKATRALILPMRTKHPTKAKSKRPLRACVVQTVTPTDDDFQCTDLALNKPEIRQKHRNHLSSTLAVVERMLALRETHEGGEWQLDWLILPELAVHPKDVRTHLVPFARAHKSMILAGLTYEKILPERPLVNSALWVIPEWSEAYGLQIRTRRQGKKHLAPFEQKLDPSGPNGLQGFRPCQWLIGYPWSSNDHDDPVWLTAAVCYDATDLGLAVDLRNESDVLAIPALNKDVKTFDQMALALHYHMFQLVIVANNGKYGGSNAYWPTKDHHSRRIFHTYGQPQTAISFLEISDIPTFRTHITRKHPPAGLRKTLP